jgi:hypothetical protein
VSINLDGVTLQRAPKDAVPHCPACRKPLHTVWVKTHSQLDTRDRVMLCPHCRVWLGYSFDG